MADVLPQEIPSEVQKLLDEARRNKQPRKHHVVPTSYLKRWEVDGKVQVHQLDDGSSHRTAASRAARQTDYYRAEAEGIDPTVVPPMLFETVLSRVEEPAVAAIDELIAVPERIDEQVRYDMATFMAFQHARGHQTRLRLRALANETVKLQMEGMSDDDIRRRLAVDGAEVAPEEIAQARKTIEQLQNDELFVAPQDAAVISQAFEHASLVARILFERPWIVCTTPATLVTTDEPVLPIGGPGSPRTETSGFGVAGIVAFPLSPERVLLAMRQDLARSLGLWVNSSWMATMELDFIETMALSRELVMAAARWAFERPDRNVVGRLVVPHRPNALSTEEFASESGDSSVIRLFDRTRWENADLLPDWPLDRLWPPGWRSQPLPPELATQLEAMRHEELSKLRNEGK